MKKLKLVVRLVLMLVVSAPLLISLFSCNKDCGCEVAPTNLQVEEQTDGFVFTFESSSGVDGYVITITNPLTGAKIEDGFTLSSSDPKQRKVLKANFPSFFQTATFYQATIHRDCGRVKGCIKGESGKTPPILIQTKAGPNQLKGPNIVQLIGDCNEYEFVVDSIPGAQAYVLFGYDEKNHILYSDTSLNHIFPMNYARIPQQTSPQWTYYAMTIMPNGLPPTEIGPPMVVCCVVVSDGDLGATTPLNILIPSINTCNGNGCNINSGHTAVISSQDGGSGQGFLQGSIPNVPYCAGYRYKIVFRKQGLAEGWYSFKCTTPASPLDRTLNFNFKGNGIPIGIPYEVMVVPIRSTVIPPLTCLHCP